MKTPRAGTRRVLFRWLLIVGGVVLLTALCLRIGPAQIAGLLAALGANFIVIVAIFSCHECVRAAALRLCLSPHQHASYRQLLRVRFVGEAAATLTRTGPFVGEPTRAIALARGAERAAHAIGASASELIANGIMSAMVTMAVVLTGLWMHAFRGPIHVLALVLLWGSAGYVTIAAGALLSRTYVIGGIMRVVTALPWIGRRVKVTAADVRRMEDAIVHSLTSDGRRLAGIALLELLAQCILVFEIYWTVKSMGLPFSAASAFLVEVLIKAPNAIQFIGATEGGYALVFNWLGLAAAVGFTLSLVRLLRSLCACALWLTLLARPEQPVATRKHAPQVL